MITLFDLIALAFNGRGDFVFGAFIKVKVGGFTILVVFLVGGEKWILRMLVFPRCIKLWRTM